MKNVGIVTLYHNNYNYGGQLQAFAMQKLFTTDKSIATLIKFETNRNKYIVQRFFDLGFKKSFKNLTNKVIFKKMLLNREFKVDFNRKINRFEEFMNKIPHTELYNETNIEDLNSKFDIFVCGSDQIWNPGWWNDILLLEFTDKPKFAYAASIARNNLTENQLKKLESNLIKYNKISIRENQSKLLLEKEIGIETELVLDPTILLDESIWKEMLIKPNFHEEYVLFYMVGDSKGLKEKVYNQCKKFGYKVISIGFSKNTYFKSDTIYTDYIIKDAGPLEWLGLFSEAKYIFTDSFHGSIFSIIFEKQFWCFERDIPTDKQNENSRIYNFLSLTKLEGRLLEYDSKINFNDMNEQIEFSEVKSLLEPYKEKSLKFINECLE